MYCYFDNDQSGYAAQDALNLNRMTGAAKERGYDYIAITDHSKHVTVDKGLDVKRLEKQIEKIDRLINERRPYEINVERVMNAAKDRGCFLELNAHPDRLDLNDTDCKMAKDTRVKVALATDAHRLDDLDLMRFGIRQARRGWLEPDDILNTRSWRELRKLLKRI